MASRPEPVRQPAVAGPFYPDRKPALVEILDRAVQGGRGGEQAVAVVVPHGGNSVSWAVAGAVYGRLALPSRAVVVGPNHSGIGQPFSLCAGGLWETPLGRVPVEAKLARRILKAAPDLKKDPKAHEKEHAAELQLPFLQRLGRLKAFVPVAVSSADLETIRRIGAGLAEALRGAGEPVLLIASTNLTRHEPVDQAREKDRLAIDRILALDEEGLVNLGQERGISMCGVAATAAVLVAAKRLGGSGGLLVQHRLSSELTGEQTSVVGYAGILLR